MTAPIDTLPREAIKQQALALKLHGLIANWDILSESDLPIIQRLIAWEDLERKRRGLERRLGAAHIGRFKSLADFDWHWPQQCDRAAVSDLMTLGFIGEKSNIILVGPNGTGKSMIAQNIAHHAVMQGHSALFINAAQMLGDLAAQDGDNALRRRLAHYARPDVLVIDEIGYLSYGNRHADLLFNIVNRRYELKPTVYIQLIPHFYVTSIPLYILNHLHPSTSATHPFVYCPSCAPACLFARLACCPPFIHACLSCSLLSFSDAMTTVASLPYLPPSHCFPSFSYARLFMSVCRFSLETGLVSNMSTNMFIFQ